jgi:hypothetical protein
MTTDNIRLVFKKKFILSRCCLTPIDHDKT